jgi:hypothetical protein
LLFVPGIISEQHRVPRGNPGPQAVRQAAEQRDDPLFSAVIRCSRNSDARMALTFDAMSVKADEA